MSGDLFMMRLWKYVDAKKLDNKSKANIFLIMNIILWSGIAFLLSLIAGVFCGYSAEWDICPVIQEMPSQVCNTKSVLTNPGWAY